MCDYSLHLVASRSARVGDKLVVASFAGTYTRGFAAVGKSTVAVCLSPGTELAFEKDIGWDRPLLLTLFRKKPASGRLVRFRQINMERPGTHHDAIEFPNGHTVLLNDLKVGQKAIVVQLPVAPRMERQVRLVESQLDGSVIDLVPTRADRSDWLFFG